MDGNFAVVTGGSSGLGLEIARLLLRRGIGVCVVARDPERLDRAAADLAASAPGARLLKFACNVGEEASVSALWKFLAARDIVPRFLFNVAGVHGFFDAAQISARMIHQVFEASLVGLILMCSHGLRAMAGAGDAVIVNVMSTSALVGRGYESVYCAAKWGARGFTESLRLAAAGTPVKVLSVYPGGMETAFWEGIREHAVGPESFMRPAEVAAKIVEAATSSDSSVITELTIRRAR